MPTPFFTESYSTILANTAPFLPEQIPGWLPYADCSTVAVGHGRLAAAGTSLSFNHVGNGYPLFALTVNTRTNGGTVTGVTWNTTGAFTRIARTVLTDFVCDLWFLASGAQPIGTHAIVVTCDQSEFICSGSFEGLYDLTTPYGVFQVSEVTSGTTAAQTIANALYDNVLLMVADQTSLQAFTLGTGLTDQDYRENGVAGTSLRSALGSIASINATSTPSSVSWTLGTATTKLASIGVSMIMADLNPAYPNLYRAEEMKITADAGPNGENVAEIDTTGGYTWANAAMYFSRFGEDEGKPSAPVTTPQSPSFTGGLYTLPEGFLRFEAAYFFNTAMWSNLTNKTAYFATIRMSTNANEATVTDVIWIGGTVPAAVTTYFIPAISYTYWGGTSGTLYLKSDNTWAALGSIVGGLTGPNVTRILRADVENTWHTCRLDINFGTINGAWTSVSADGDLEWTLFNTSTGIPVLNSTISSTAFYSSQYTEVLSHQLGDLVIGTDGNGTFGSHTNIRVYSSLTDPVSGGGGGGGVMASSSPGTPITAPQLYRVTEDESTAKWIDVRGRAHVVFYLTGRDTISGGVVTFEEGSPEDFGASGNPPAPFGAAVGSYSAITTQTASSVSGGKQLAVHMPVAGYFMVRARVSTAITGGGTLSAGVVAY